MPSMLNLEDGSFPLPNLHSFAFIIIILFFIFYFKITIICVIFCLNSGFVQALEHFWQEDVIRLLGTLRKRLLISPFYLWVCGLNLQCFSMFLLIKMEVSVSSLFKFGMNFSCLTLTYLLSLWFTVKSSNFDFFSCSSLRHTVFSL